MLHAHTRQALTSLAVRHCGHPFWHICSSFKLQSSFLAHNRNSKATGFCCGIITRAPGRGNFTCRAAYMAAQQAPAFCTPSDGVYCPGCSWSGGTCYNGECEGLHEDPDVRRAQGTWQRPEKGKLIIAAGPERSGSTWLFNAIRLLYQDAEEPLDPFWITSVTEEALIQRGAGQKGHPHVLVKTHRWSNGWDHTMADHIFLTHRDLRGVLASYQRVGWAFDISESYVAEHMRWRDIAHHDFAFEDIIDDSEQQLRTLAEALGVSHKVDIKSVAERVDALKAPAGGPPDAVTKLWPRHMSQAVQQKQEGTASSQTGAGRGGDLKDRFPAYFEVYGYD